MTVGSATGAAAAGAGEEAAVAGMGAGGVVITGAALTAAVAGLIVAANKMASATGTGVTTSQAQKFASTGRYSGKAGSGGGVRSNAYQTTDGAYKASSGAMIEKAVLQLELRGGGDKAMNDAMKTIAALRTAAAKRIDFTIDPKKPLDGLRSIMARLQGTGMSAQRAYKVVQSVFGKDFTGPFRKYLLGMPPAMDKAAQAVETRHHQLVSKLQARVSMGHLDPGNMLSVISQLTSAMRSLGYSADQTAAAVARATTRHPSGSGGGTHIAKSAAGRVVRSPLVTWVGEAGPEVILPLNNTKRALDLLSQSGLMQELDYAGGGSMPAGAHGHRTINLNVIVPGGTTIVGTARQVAEVIAPHVGRALDRADARKGRSR